MDRDWKFAFKISIAFLVTVFLAWLLVKILPVLTYFLLAFIIVYFISPLFKFMVAYRFPPAAAALVSFLLIILILGLIFYLIVPGMVGELMHLAQLKEYIPDLEELMNYLEEIDQHWNLEVTRHVSEYLNEIIDDIPATLEALANRLIAVSQDFLSSLWAALLVVFIVFYLLIGQEKVRQQLPKMFPQMYRQDVTYVLSIIDEKVGAYIRGTILRCFILGFFIGTVLYFVGMPFSLMLGIIAGVLDVIIYIGPVMAAVPAVLLSLLPGTPHFLVIIGIYVLAQLIESMVITPLLMGKAVDLSPLTIIAAILIGGQLGGILGIIISIPVAAVLKVLLNHYYLDPMENSSSPAGDE